MIINLFNLKKRFNAGYELYFINLWTCIYISVAFATYKNLCTLTGFKDPLRSKLSQLIIIEYDNY